MTAMAAIAGVPPKLALITIVLLSAGIRRSSEGRQHEGVRGNNNNQRKRQKRTILVVYRDFEKMPEPRAAAGYSSVSSGPCHLVSKCPLVAPSESLSTRLATQRTFHRCGESTAPKQRKASTSIGIGSIGCIGMWRPALRVVRSC